MGTKRPFHQIRKNSEEHLSVPPGFVSLTSLTFKRIVNDGEAADRGIIDAPLSNSDIEKLKNSFRQRRCMPRAQVDSVSAKCDSEDSGSVMICSSGPSLPKGVNRGCAICYDCVKVTARWHPEESCLPVLDDAPVFHPTKEEFQDTLKYIASIRPKAENFGICRIVPPRSWRPPCLLRDRKTWKDSKFHTYSQNIDGLRDMYLKRKLSGVEEKPEAKRPKVLAGMELKPCDRPILDTKEAKCTSLGPEFESGPEFSLQSFKSYADHFKSQYFCRNDNVTDQDVSLNGVKELSEPLIARVEGEYWRIINNPTEEIEVLCGSNLETQTFGSGFPIECSPGNTSEYVKTGWNLNNTPKLSSSLLPFGCCATSDILIPKLSVGMCFATQCWRKEEHHLYSLCYMHLGEPKVWYGIPGRYCFKFVEVIKKQWPQLSNYPALLHELVTQISPSVLMSEGVPVYRCVQNPLEFVLAFPGAYHSEFDSGFNCSEAVRFAPFDWLVHGQNIVELYRDFCRKTSISHDRLLLGAAMEAVLALWDSCVIRNDSSSNQLWRSVCGKNGVLSKALKSRVKLEDIRREHLCDVTRSRAFDDHAAVKIECCICSYDLYLSAVGCSCSPNIYTCLLHDKQLCSCAWSDKSCFFRFGIEELKLLVEGLEEENLKAIHYWAKKKIRPLTDTFGLRDGLSENGMPSSGNSPRGKEDNRTVKRASSDSSRQKDARHSDTNIGTLGKGRESMAASQSNPHLIVIDDEDE